MSNPYRLRFASMKLNRYVYPMSSSRLITSCFALGFLVLKSRFLKYTLKNSFDAFPSMPSSSLASWALSAFFANRLIWRMDAFSSGVLYLSDTISECWLAILFLTSSFETSMSFLLRYCFLRSRKFPLLSGNMAWYGLRLKLRNTMGKPYFLAFFTRTDVMVNSPITKTTKILLQGCCNKVLLSLPISTRFEFLNFSLLKLPVSKSRTCFDMKSGLLIIFVIVA